MSNSAVTTTSPHGRQRWASAQSRLRQRAKDGVVVFKLALPVNLVAIVLQAAAYQRGRDLTEHSQCETALAEWFHAQCVVVIDDLHDPMAHAILRELLKPASKVVAA